MSAKKPTKAIRHALSPFTKAGQTKTKKKVTKISVPHVPEGHGREIWVYQNLRTRQVVYSLSKAMNNNAALKQLPFHFKKTVPPSLRKDHWAPLASITFPRKQGPTGLSVYQKLRELRVRHEHEWEPSSMIRAVDNVVMTRKQRGYKLMDQKANSIADMAEVLGRLWDGAAAREIGLGRLEGRARVDVRWRDLSDAEFAETWRGNVVHDSLEVTANHRSVPWNLQRVGGEEVVDVEGVVDGEVVEGRQEGGVGGVKEKGVQKTVEDGQPKKKSAWSKVGSWIPISLPGSSK